MVKFDSYEDAVKSYDELVEVLGKTADVSLVSHQPIPPDASLKPKKVPKGKHLTWCPYCGQWRIFKSNRLGYQACPVCTMTDNDFHVRQHNRLWGK